MSIKCCNILRNQPDVFSFPSKMYHSINFYADVVGKLKLHTTRQYGTDTEQRMWKNHKIKEMVLQTSLTDFKPIGNRWICKRLKASF